MLIIPAIGGAAVALSVFLPWFTAQAGLFTISVNAFGQLQSGLQLQVEQRYVKAAGCMAATFNKADLIRQLTLCLQFYKCFII
jgi:hypothetical protein